MKKALKIIGILFLIIICFRGFFYRSFICYKEIGTRTEIMITNPQLIHKIEAQSANYTIDAKTITSIANNITKETLYFSGRQAFRDPNVLIDKHKANCVGYSTMFNSIANYLIRKHHLERQIEARHLIGQLNFMGINLHQFFHTPFFKDHDFNEITNLKTGKSISIDPSVSDYLYINRVSH